MNESILIVGAGAIGGMLAGYLAAAGRNVSVLARGDTAAALSTRGLTLATPDGRRLASRPRVVATGAELPVQDIVLFTTKAFSLDAAMQVARAAIGPQTLVAPVVNGIPWWFGTAQQPVRAVDPHGRLAAAIAPECLVGAVTYSPAWRSVEDALWTQTVPGKLTLGPPVAGASTAAAERIAAVFAGSTFDAEVTADIRRAVWSKFATNAAFNTMCALTGARQCDVARDPVLGRTAHAIMREIDALARATGSEVAGSLDDRMAQAREKGIHKPSTLQDFEAGRQIELGALVDAPLEMATSLGVPMPALELIGAAVRLKATAAGLLPPNE
jgi:2-dehydropantoate 2-reductase